MKIWVFFGQTESGDGVGPYMFDKEPIKLEIQAILMEDWPSEFAMDKEEWIDPYYGYVSLSTLSCSEVIELKR